MLAKGHPRHHNMTSYYATQTKSIEFTISHFLSTSQLFS